MQALEMPHVCQVMFTGHCIIFFLDRARLILIPLRLLQLPELLRWPWCKCLGWITINLQWSSPPINLQWSFLVRGVVNTRAWISWPTNFFLNRSPTWQRAIQDLVMKVRVLRRDKNFMLSGRDWYKLAKPKFWRFQARKDWPGLSTFAARVINISKVGCDA